MYFIPVKLYGVLDYLFGLLLMSSPWLFHFAPNEAVAGAETITPVFIGVNLFMVALITNTEWGLSKIISFETHLAIDLVAGLFLAASPWLFNFVTIVYAPHLIIGLLAVFMVAATKRGPVHRRIKHLSTIIIRPKTA